MTITCHTKIPFRVKYAANQPTPSTCAQSIIRDGRSTVTQQQHYGQMIGEGGTATLSIKLGVGVYVLRMAALSDGMTFTNSLKMSEKSPLKITSLRGLMFAHLGGLTISSGESLRLLASMPKSKNQNTRKYGVLKTFHASKDMILRNATGLTLMTSRVWRKPKTGFALYAKGSAARLETLALTTATKLEKSVGYYARLATAQLVALSTTFLFLKGQSLTLKNRWAA